MAFCRNCGAKLEDGVKFCMECGTPVPAAEAAKPVPAAEAAKPVPAPEAPVQETAPTEEPAPAAEQPAQKSYTPPAQGSYTPPAQGSYTPPTQRQQSCAPQTGGSGPQAPKAKKPLNKKLFILGGALLAVILLIVIIVASCGGKKTASTDPNLGIYTLETIRASGLELSADSVYDGAFTVELKDKGKCVMVVEDAKASGKWELTGDDGITLTVQGAEYSGTLGSGTLILQDMQGSGQDYVFINGEYREPVATSSDSGKTEGGAAVTQAPAASDAGEYALISMTTGGYTSEKDILDAAGIKGYVRLNEDGTGSMSLTGSDNNQLTWADGALTRDDGLILSYTLENGRLTIEISGTIWVFSNGTGEPVVEAFVSPTTAMELGTLWLGSVTVSNHEAYTGDALLTDGVTDAWAAYNQTSGGQAYFEAFDVEEMSSSNKDPILSLWVMPDEQGFTADIGVEDAWIYDLWLETTDNGDFSPTLDNGALIMSYAYESNDEKCDILFFFRVEGTPWNEESDPLPPSYTPVSGGSSAPANATGGNTAAAGTPEGNEPSSTGSGQLKSMEDLYRLTKWLWDMESSYQKTYCTYEFVANYIGVEGQDDGNNGSTYMTPYGDHYFFWRYDNTRYIYVGFRCSDGEKWVCCGFNTSGFKYSDIPSDISVSYEEIAGEGSGFGGQQSFTIDCFMTDIMTTVSFTLPESNWFMETYSTSKIYLYNVVKKDAISSNSPRIQFSAQSTLDRINFYYDKFENVKEIASRTVGGVTLQGRTYKDVGMQWTEYYGQLPSGIYISVLISGVDISAGSAGDGILNSVSFQ